jgi:hypothetical protein
VVDQNFLAAPRNPAAVLLQAGQHDLIAGVHLGATKPRNVACAGIVLVRGLRRGGSREDHQGKSEKKSGHFCAS